MPTVTVKRRRIVSEDITVVVVNGRIDRAIDENGERVILTDSERQWAFGMVADGLDETGV